AAELLVTDETIEKLSGVFKLLADNNRLKIVLALAQHGKVHVQALCDMLGERDKPASQPAVSHHLTLMRMVGLIKYERRGKENHYYLNTPYVSTLLTLLFTELGDDKQALEFQDVGLKFTRIADE